MAETQKTQATKVRGKDLMLFLTDGETTKAIALVTNSTISITANTNEYKTKDDTEDSAPEVESISWEATSESMYSVEKGLDAQHTADSLIKIMLAKKLIGVALAQTSAAGTNTSVPAGGWTEKDGAFLISGKAFITSLEVTATNGEYANVSITLTGKGSLDTLG